MGIHSTDPAESGTNQTPEAESSEPPHVYVHGFGGWDFNARLTLKSERPYGDFIVVKTTFGSMDVSVKDLLDVLRLGGYGLSRQSSGWGKE